MSQLVPAEVRRRLARAVPNSLLRRGRRLLQGQSVAHRLVRAARLGLSRGMVRHSRGLDASASGLVPVAVDGRVTLAAVVRSFRADEVYARQAAAVADALEARDVPYFYLSTEPHRRRTLVVPAPERDRTLTALAGELAGTATYVAPVYSRRPRRARSLNGRKPRFTETLRVFQVLATPGGAYLSGAEMGCDLQFWRPADGATTRNSSGEPLVAGSLVGERTFDPVPEMVEPTASSVVLLTVDGHPRPAVKTAEHPHVFQVVEPIDVVYTWVDGSDPAWQRRKAEALGSMTDPRLHALAANASRYASRDELRYSLRSLEMYASWVRHVYLVTDDQVPAWLEPDHPGLTVVSHRELFDGRGRLPTFNSHAIETQLHHIDGLSENYLYFNDDVFLGRPTTPEQFVLANGLSRFFLSSVKVAPGPVRPTDLPITSAAKNGRDLLLKTFGRSTTHKFQHVPYSLRRSVMFELEDLFADEIAATARAQFRSPTDISMSASLGLYYAFLTGRAVPGRLPYLYADIARPETRDRLDVLLRKRDFDVFCLNDHDSSHLSTQAQTDVVHSFLERYFPLPSRYEREPTPAEA